VLQVGAGTTGADGAPWPFSVRALKVAGRASGGVAARSVEVSRKSLRMLEVAVPVT
jgi:hypothetical protein